MKIPLLIFISLISLHSSFGAPPQFENVQITCHDNGDDIFSQTCQSLQKLKVSMQDERLRSRLLGVIQEQANRILQLVQENPKKNFDDVSSF